MNSQERAGSDLSQSGFSLIELMVTVAVVLLALVGYIGANTAVQRRGAENFEKTMALQDANRVIEQMRNASATGNFPGNVTGVFPDGGTVGGFTSLTNEQVTVDYVDPTSNPLDTTVTVSWDQNGMRTVDVSLRTLITQRSTS